jgi:hypothetical protein
MRRILLSILAIGILQLSACASPTTAPTSDKWMEEVTSAWVVSHSNNWDADAEDDGIRVWVELLDKQEDMIEYQNVEMPVKIEVYSTESKTFPWKPSRLIYSGTTVLHNWHDDAFVTGNTGVKDIAWEEISPPLPSEQQEYGLLYVTVTLPNSKDYSAREDN